MKNHRESFHTAPITRCVLSWRGRFWHLLDALLDITLLAIAGTVLGYALANLLA